MKLKDQHLLYTAHYQPSNPLPHPQQRQPLQTHYPAPYHLMNLLSYLHLLRIQRTFQSRSLYLQKVQTLGSW